MNKMGLHSRLDRRGPQSVSLNIPLNVYRHDNNRYILLHKHYVKICTIRNLAANQVICSGRMTKSLHFSTLFRPVLGIDRIGSKGNWTSLKLGFLFSITSWGMEGPWIIIIFSYTKKRTV